MDLLKSSSVSHDKFPGPKAQVYICQKVPVCQMYGLTGTHSWDFHVSLRCCMCCLLGPGFSNLVSPVCWEPCFLQLAAPLSLSLGLSDHLLRHSIIQLLLNLVFTSLKVFFHITLHIFVCVSSLSLPSTLLMLSEDLLYE